MQELSIHEIQAKMESGQLSATQLVKQYLERIEAIDKNGPTLNAVIEVNPQALEIAQLLDVERENGKQRGLMHGIPVMLKDNFDTADQMSTTAGSLALNGNTSQKDSTVAAKLRQAGAIILAKTNLSEWANFRSEHSSSGWSSRGGQTKNPYALDRNPCGSSSGSAVAVAANLCSVAIGTETDGSVVCPSHANGIVGLKPTVGLISRAGIIPIAHSQDTAGPMARTVEDLAILLGVLTGEDQRDPETNLSQGKEHKDYTQFLDQEGLNGARIGVARNYFGYNPDVDKLIEDCIHILRDAGAEVIEQANIIQRGEELKDDDILADSGPMGTAEYEVLLYEFKHDLNKYLGTLGPQVEAKTLADIISYNQAHPELVMPYFGQERMLKAQEKGPLSDEAYLKALETSKRLARAEGIDSVLTAHKLDAIVAPTGGPAWLTDWINGDHYSGASSSLAAVAGYPNITVPAGYIWGLPVGISFFAGAFQEPNLLKFAYAFEQATKVRRSPQFLPTVKFH
jgi:amidase